MEYQIINSQFGQLRFNLLSDIREHIKRLNSYTINFTNTFFYVESNNPDMVYSIYGIENGSVMHDTFYQGITTFELEKLSIDALLFIKNELDIFEKNRIIIENISI